MLTRSLLTLLAMCWIQAMAAELEGDCAKLVVSADPDYPPLHWWSANATWTSCARRRSPIRWRCLCRASAASSSTPGKTWPATRAASRRAIPSARSTRSLPPPICGGRNRARRTAISANWAWAASTISSAACSPAKPGWRVMAAARRSWRCGPSWRKTRTTMPSPSSVPAPATSTRLRRGSRRQARQREAGPQIVQAKVRLATIGAWSDSLAHKLPCITSAASTLKPRT